MIAELQEEVKSIIIDNMSIGGDMAFIDDMTKQITDLIERRLDIPDSHLIRMSELQREVTELRDKWEMK